MQKGTANRTVLDIPPAFRNDVLRSKQVIIGCGGGFHQECQQPYSPVASWMEDTDVALNDEMLFKLLGVSFAETGKKATPFGQVFRLLGLVVEMSDLQSGHVSVSHTDERRREVLKSDSLTRKEAERLKGRMVFFEGYTFGRVANDAIKQLGRRITQGNQSERLDPPLRRCLHFLASRVLQAGPIKIHRCLNETWIVFIDGACSPEEQSGSVGGVLISPQGDVMEFFSEYLSCELFQIGVCDR